MGPSQGHPMGHQPQMPMHYNQPGLNHLQRQMLNQEGLKQQQFASMLNN